VTETKIIKTERTVYKYSPLPYTNFTNSYLSSLSLIEPFHSFIMLFNSLALGAASLSLAAASALPEAQLTPLVKKQSCVNSATDRACWDPVNGFSIDTDAEVTWPDTGVVVQVTYGVTSLSWKFFKLRW
jgi:hypothetical protein